MNFESAAWSVARREPIQQFKVMRSWQAGCSAIAAAALSATCGSSTPTNPSSLSFSGRWNGTFTVTSCSRTTDGPEGMGCGDLLPGAKRPVVLVLKQKGATVAGVGVIGDISPYRTSESMATIDPDEHLRMSTGWGQPPAAVHLLSWDLRHDSNEQLRGTLAVSQTSYRLRGAAISAGDVEVTREGPDQPF